jgi:drug/metabolite transporter (DMT)-like permease
MSERRGTLAAAAACLVGAMLCHGSVPIFIRHFAVATTLDDWTVNGVRYTVGALVWCPLLLATRRRPELAGIWRAALVPVAVNICGQIGWAKCPYFNEASVIGFVIRMAFPFAILFGVCAVPSERALVRRPWFWVGTVGCLAGVVVMYAGAGLGDALGVGIILLTAMCWGGYAVAVQRWLGAYPARYAFAVVSACTQLVLVTLMLVFGDYRQLAVTTAAEWLYLALSAVLGIAFAHVLMYRAIQGLGSIVTSGGALITPFFTYLCAAAFLGERLNGQQWLGGCILVAGGGLLVFARWRDVARAAPES